MNFSSVLIVTYGRSGSTLLQGLLNSIDGVLVRGENYNLCYGLFQAYQSLRQAKAEFGQGEKSLHRTSPWYGAALLDEQRFLRDARALVRHQLNPSDDDGVRCLGFKEIRYVPRSDDLRKNDLTAYLDFLAVLFPNPAFIFLTREHGEVLNSAWWKTSNHQKAKRRIQAFEDAAQAYAANKNWVFSITYRDLVDRTETIPELFRFLGAPYDRQQVEGVLSTMHGYSTNPLTLARFRNFRVEIIGAQPLVARTVIDRLPTTIGDAEEFMVGGIVVLAGPPDGDHKLVIQDAAGEHAVEWGLPSLNMAKKFSDNQHARNARFRATGLRAEREKPVKLLLASAEGTRHLLAELHLV